MIKKMWRAVCAWWWEWKVSRLYEAYHQSLGLNIYDGIARWGLPVKTLQLRAEFNAAVKQLQKVRPLTTWKLMN